MQRPRPALPPFDRTTALVARALGVTSDRLLAALTIATADDLDDVLAFRRECFGGDVSWDDRRYLAWRYGLDPARRAYGRLRVLRLDGAVLGIIGVEEFALRIGADAIRAACPMDLVVHARCLDAGLGAWLNLALARSYEALVALGANENSLGLVTRLYFPIAGRTTFKFPLNLSDFLDRRLAVPFAGALLGAAANVGLRLRFEQYRIGTLRDRSHVALHTRFDPAWDAALAAESASVVKMQRSTDYLNWRFAENPRAPYAIVAATDAAGGLRAYAVFRRPTSGQDVHVHDYWVASDDAQALRAVMVRVVELGRENASRFVSATAMAAAAQQRLRDCGFVPRSSAARLTALLTGTPGSPLARAAEWDLTDLGDDADGRV